MKKMFQWAAGLAAAGAGMGAILLARSQYERNCLEATHYTLRSPKIRGDRKTFVFLSDLHDKEFGRGNERLIQAVRREKPDGILIGGDMMVAKGEGDTRIASELILSLASEFPVYYANGNHESRMARRVNTYGMRYQEYKKKLVKAGVIFLVDRKVSLGENLKLYGLDIPDKCYYFRHPKMDHDFLEKTLGLPDPDCYNMLLAHSPLFFKEYSRWGADLALAGHFHGGTIRLPVLGGLMTPQYQFFHPWCAGMSVDKSGNKKMPGRWKKMIVSRGLGTHSINIRLNNKPQIVVLHLEPDTIF